MVVGVGDGVGGGKEFLCFIKKQLKTICQILLVISLASFNKLLRINK